MKKKYKAWVETENIGNKKLVYLFVSHKGSSSTGIRIEDPISEIPLIVDALQCHLTSAMHSDGEGQCKKFDILAETIQKLDPFAV